MKISIENAGCSQTPENHIEAGYQIYNTVYEKRPETLFLLNKSKVFFKPDETFLAIKEENNQVVGVATRRKINGAVKAKHLFGENAGDIVQNVIMQMFSAPIYEVGSIAVLPEVRRHGVGSALFRGCAEYDDGTCVAIITDDNHNSIAAATKGGYRPIANSQCLLPMSVFGLQDNRTLSAHWYHYRTP